MNRVPRNGPAAGTLRTVSTHVLNSNAACRSAIRSARNALCGRIGDLLQGIKVRLFLACESTQRNHARVEMTSISRVNVRVSNKALPPLRAGNKRSRRAVRGPSNNANGPKSPIWQALDIPNLVFRRIVMRVVCGVAAIGGTPKDGQVEIGRAVGAADQ
ncbi:hypothetical protein VTL71DRAFT_4186 [Oculimacula yallundae]|uniref:Uncharacterized protein n=1 Tax=Oculimacula yallundae TaxID=86028 RepID=A0ABR4C6A3_9HELO